MTARYLINKGNMLHDYKAAPQPFVSNYVREEHICLSFLSHVRLEHANKRAILVKFLTQNVRPMNSPREYQGITVSLSASC